MIELVAWCIANGLLSRSTRIVSHLRLVLLSWCITAFQVRSTNIHLLVLTMEHTHFCALVTYRRALCCLHYLSHDTPLCLFISSVIWYLFEVWISNCAFMRSAEQLLTIIQICQFHYLGVQEHFTFPFLCQHTFTFVLLFLLLPHKIHTLGISKYRKISLKTIL